MQFIPFIYRLYAFMFSRPFFIRLNKLLYQLSLRGLGILNYEGEYLQGEKKWISNYLSKLEMPTIFDVGANRGNYSSKIFKANLLAQVYAFEPHPKTFEKLKDIKGQRRNLNIFNVAIGANSGRLRLYDYKNKDGSTHASIYKDVIVDLHNANSISCEVDVITIDDFVKKNSIKKIDLLKIDTEGNEYNVLIGALNTINNKSIYAIQLEFNEMNLYSETTFKKIWELLRDYDFYRLLPGGKLFPLNRYDPLYCEIYAFQNIIALLKS